LGEDAVALLGKLFFMTATQVNILSKFLLPAAAFLLAYALVLVMSGSRAAALLGAALAIVGTDLMSYPSGIIELLRGRSLQDGIYWARPINPEVSGVMLFGALLLLYRSFTQSHVARTSVAILIGLLVGASLYVSVFLWLFLGALLLLLFGYHLWKCNFLIAKQICVSGALALLCAVPFLINHMQAVVYPGYQLASLQFGIVTSHAPIVGIWVLVLLLFPLAMPAHFSRARLFFIMAALALALLLNQQIISGIYLQPGHFHWYITKPLVGLLLGICIVIFAEFLRIPRVIRLLGYGVLLGVLLASATLAQMHFYRLHASAALAAQAYAPIFDYLNQDTKHEVVFADTSLSSYISLYTSADAPDAGYAGLFIAPKDYFDQRLFLEYKLRGIQPKDALSTMQSERADIFTRLYGVYWNIEIPKGSMDTMLQSIADTYVTAYHDESVPEMVRSLGATLLVRDTMLDQWDAPQSAYLKQIELIDGRFEIYGFVSH